MSRSFTLSSVGGIPDDELLRKMEYNDLNEDPYMLENHMRTHVTDFSTDAPFFESDQSRSNNGSKERLSLRHSGGRVEDTPYLPDGTFLDYEFTQRDPRGVQNLPDFGKAGRDQQMARKDFIKFGKDDDLSIAESQINPTQMSANIRSLQGQFKDRFQNFEDSTGAWHNGSAAQRGETSSVAMITTDGQIANLNDATYQQRRDPVDILSNRTLGVSRYTTPDHRVNVSKYGQVRPVLDMNSNAWSTNRSNANLDHQIPVMVNGQMVNRMLGNVILDIQAQRDASMRTGENTIYSDSKQQNTKSVKHVNPDDVFKAAQLALTSTSQPSQEFMTNNVNRVKSYKSNIRNANENSINTQFLVDSITTAAKTLKKLSTDDLRSAVATSQANDYTHLQQNNRTSANRQTDISSMQRESFDTRYIENSMEVKSYAGVAPAKAPSTMLNSNYEDFAQTSLNTKNGKKSQIKSNHSNIVDTELGTNFRGEFALPTRKEALKAGGYGGRRLQAEFGEDENIQDSVGVVDLRSSYLSMLNDE